MAEYYLSGVASTAIDTRRSLLGKWLRRLRAIKGDTSTQNEWQITDTRRELLVKILRVLNI